MTLKEGTYTANRYFTSQFSYSFERQLVELVGQFVQSGSTGTFAVKVTQGLTLTAVTMGTGGNSITIAFTAGATAGSEVVTVTGNAISVQIETGVSTVTQVRTALNASTAAAALVTTTGTSSSTVATAAALPLLTGTSTAFTSNAKGMSIAQTGTGIFTITLQDSYTKLLGCGMAIQKAAAADIKAQVVSSDVTTAKTVVIRTIAVATPTNLASGDILFVDLKLRNSAT